MLANTAGITHWGPNGASIAYTRSRSPYDPERDVWTMAATGADLRQVTHAFPTGVSFNDFDWIPGTVPVHTASPPNLLSLPTSSELSLDWVDGLAQAGAPDSVVYRDGAICDPDAENESAMFEAWTPPATSVVTTTTPCLDMALRSFAVGASLVAWASDYDLAGHTTIAVARPGTSDAQIASWNAAEEAPDIGWRSEIGDLVSDGSTIFFESWDANSHPMLWRIADSVIPHAISVPLPSDAGYLIDADGGRVVLSGSSGDLVVLAPDGTVTSRLPLHSLIPNPSIGISQGRVRIGGGLVGTISGDTLRVYDEDVAPFAMQSRSPTHQATRGFLRSAPAAPSTRAASKSTFCACRTDLTKPSPSPARPAQSELS